jgi:hypothetical protein
MKLSELKVGGIYKVGKFGDIMLFLGSCGTSNVLYFKDIKGSSGFKKTRFKQHKEAVGFYTPRFKDLPCEFIMQLVK